MEPVAVLIHVTDIGSALEWYCKAFPSSRVLISELNELAVLDMNGFSLELVKADSKVANGKNGSVLYWSVSSLDEALTRLLSMGAKLYRGPMLIKGGLGMCQVEDPDGNLIGLRGRINSTEQIDA